MNTTMAIVWIFSKPDIWILIKYYPNYSKNLMNIIVATIAWPDTWITTKYYSNYKIKRTII